MSRRVAITGMGVISPIGSGLEKFWSAIKEGKCGIDEITAFDTTDFTVKLAGEVKDFDPKEYMDKKEAKRMDRFCQFAIGASQMAIDDSGLDLEKIDSEKIGVVIGSGVGGINTIETEIEKLHKRGPSKVSPFFIPMIISNMASGLVAIRFEAKGVNLSVVSACASGTNAIGESFKKIQSGVCDIMLAGGSEASVTPATVAGFSSMTALCTNNDKNRASIPFDKERSGFVMGEGAGMLVMEEYEHAVARGATIYAEIVGYGATCDAHHMTAPHPEGKGAAGAIAGAIEDAGIEKEKVGYINAHGTSTPYNDKLETLAIKNVFGDYAYNVPVSSTKSMTGHLIGGAGAVEAIATIMALKDGFLPATINYKVPDPECDLDIIPNEGRKADIEYAMSNSLGFGGHNATVLFKRG
ncbi:3-oxoacyl-[acyl-carrier-protein] synthase II [Dethiosulfatibacter aminovorans DSM 17477]|uniref:3-oxoacyl-[acyl-carrier-protein] synthase 2 n=1 Tax=Dethiosulfatibacter aminovorans DSM 17477 TaxID=1121476 RepID=A0A1M6KBP0_9FIRM|nr:beta-ketoacyl-ACP synthase II [Dethiosulfatibacter aminovorans]SHJ56371.1 3-oxoacyl-[acyl-carrier-protein] synthase II [Dethiosulfatibacter aminovorans DSM 17477]